MPRHHVIIGDGVSAASFAEFADLAAGDALTIIGANAPWFGRGLAYAGDEGKDWQYAYLLNSPVGTISPEFAVWMGDNWEQLKFKLEQSIPNWLVSNAEHIKSRDFEAVFAPRALFGEWLADRAQGSLVACHEKGVRVQTRTALATHLAQIGTGFRVTLATGEVVDADTVDIATGGVGGQRYGSDAGPLSFTSLYGNEGDIASVLNGQTVYVLGANAAMLDVLRFLQTQMDDADIDIQVISQSGQLPEALQWHRPRREGVKPQISSVFETADAFLIALDVEMAEFRAAGAQMAELRMGYYQWFQEVGLMNLIPDREQANKVAVAMDKRFRRGTFDSIADFHRLQAKGQIKHIKGEVLRVWSRHLVEGIGDVEIRVRRPDGQIEEIEADLVINCTGAGMTLGFDLLTAGLIHKGWLMLDEARRGVAVKDGLAGEIAGLRYISPNVTRIGEEVLPFPLYDYAMLRQLVQQHTHKK